MQVDCPWELKGTVMRRMTEKLHDGRVSLVDGIKLFLDKGEWALMLPDAEEAVFHVYAEASDDARATELADKYRVGPEGSGGGGPRLEATGAAGRPAASYPSVLLAMTCLQTVFSVSNTPTPLRAHASTTGDSVWLRSSVRSATEKISLRSRLFICSTTARRLRSSPWSRRFSQRLR